MSQLINTKWTSYCCLMVLCVWICPAKTQDELRWAHICAGSTLDVRCPNQHRFTAVTLYMVYRTAGCSSELTGSVQNISDCYQENRFEPLVDNINNRCKSTQICTLDFTGGQQSIDNCRQSTLNNIYTVSYTCTFDSSISLPSTTTTTTTTTETTTTTTTTTESTTSVTTTGEQCKPSDCTTSLAAGISGAVVLTLLVEMVVFCIWRRINGSIQNPLNSNNGAAEMKMSERASDDIKTAPRIKEEQWNRPDISNKNDDGLAQETENISRQQGLYEIPDPGRNVDYVNETGRSQSEYINARMEAQDDTQGANTGLYEKLGENNGDSAYTALKHGGLSRGSLS